MLNVIAVANCKIEAHVRFVPPLPVHQPLYVLPIVYLAQKRQFLRWLPWLLGTGCLVSQVLIWEHSGKCQGSSWDYFETTSAALHGNDLQRPTDCLSECHPNQTQTNSDNSQCLSTWSFHYMQRHTERWGTACPRERVWLQKWMHDHGSM